MCYLAIVSEVLRRVFSNILWNSVSIVKPIDSEIAFGGKQGSQGIS